MPFRPCLAGGMSGLGDRMITITVPSRGGRAPSHRHNSGSTRPRRSSQLARRVSSFHRLARGLRGLTGQKRGADRPAVGGRGLASGVTSPWKPDTARGTALTRLQRAHHNTVYGAGRRGPSLPGQHRGAVGGVSAREGASSPGGWNGDQTSAPLLEEQPADNEPTMSR